VATHPSLKGLAYFPGPPSFPPSVKVYYFGKSGTRPPFCTPNEGGILFFYRTTPGSPWLTPRTLGRPFNPFLTTPVNENEFWPSSSHFSLPTCANLLPPECRFLFPPRPFALLPTWYLRFFVFFGLFCVSNAREVFSTRLLGFSNILLYWPQLPPLSFFTPPFLGTLCRECRFQCL